MASPIEAKGSRKRLLKQNRLKHTMYDIKHEVRQVHLLYLNELMENMTDMELRQLRSNENVQCIQSGKVYMKPLKETYKSKNKPNRRERKDDLKRLEFEDFN